jgi:hypothetical protein
MRQVVFRPKKGETDDRFFNPWFDVMLLNGRWVNVVNTVFDSDRCFRNFPIDSTWSRHSNTLHHKMKHRFHITTI